MVHVKNVNHIKLLLLIERAVFIQPVLKVNYFNMMEHVKVAHQT